MLIGMVNISKKIYLFYVLISIFYCSSNKTTSLLWKILLSIFKYCIKITLIKCNHFVTPPYCPYDWI